MTWESPLRKYREALGLTVEQLAEKADCSPGLINLRERSKRGLPRLDTARAIAKALGVNVEDIWPEVK